MIVCRQRVCDADTRVVCRFDRHPLVPFLDTCSMHSSTHPHSANSSSSCLIRIPHAHPPSVPIQILVTMRSMGHFRRHPLWFTNWICLLQCERMQPASGISRDCAWTLRDAAVASHGAPAALAGGLKVLQSLIIPVSSHPTRLASVPSDTPRSCVKSFRCLVALEGGVVQSDLVRVVGRAIHVEARHDAVCDRRRRWQRESQDDI
jgi:hypothetical protein